MQPLRVAARSHHLTLVIGAGASVPSGLPQWTEFAEGLLKDSLGYSEKVIKRLVESQGVRLATEAAMSGLNPTEKRNLIARALYRGRKRADYVPTDLHRAVVDVASRRGPESITIITLNYDDLIERAFELAGLPVRSRSNAGYSGEAGTFTVHHPHGVLGLSGRVGGTYVVTESDYHRSRETQVDWASGLIGESAGKGPIVFVGTSLNDPSLLAYLSALRDRPGINERFAVITHQSIAVDAELEHQAEDVLRRQWEALGVTPIFVQDYGDVTTYVRELKIQTAPGIDSPARRLKALWNKVSDSFDDLQEDWSDRLAATYQTELRQILGPEGNLVLWVGDGKGSLVRVAANDRLHRSVRTLRRIPWSPATGWVATDAVSFSESDAIVRDLTAAEEPPEAVPSRRWKTISGISLTISDTTEARTVVGALTAATTRDPGRLNSAIDTDRWLLSMEASALEWEGVLSLL
jgi:hypothetical protein